MQAHFQQSQESSVPTMQTFRRKNKGQWAFINIFEDNSFAYWHTLKLLERFKCESQNENNEITRSWGMLPNLQHFWGGGACWSSKMQKRTTDKCVNYSYQSAQTKQQVG